MKLSHPLLDSSIDFCNKKIWFLIIENNKVFYNFASHLFLMSQGEVGDFSLSINNEIVNFAKFTLLLYDFLNFDFSSKKIKSILDNAVQDEMSKPEYILDLARINSQIILLNKKVASQIDLPLDFTEEINIDKIVKISEYYIQEEQSLLEKIVTYIDLFIKLKKIKIVIFVGLLSYISYEELKDLIVQLNYMQINVLFLENKDVCIKEYPKIIIDNDLCQI